MALTLNGNRTGRAAVIERQEWLQAIHEAYWEHRRRIEQSMLDFGDALSTLKADDPDWEAWYDDDANIPPEIVWTDRALIDELIRRMLERARASASRRGCVCFDVAGDNRDCPVHAPIVAQAEAAE